MWPSDGMAQQSQGEFALRAESSSNFLSFFVFFKQLPYEANWVTR